MIASAPVSLIVVGDESITEDLSSYSHRGDASSDFSPHFFWVGEAPRRDKGFCSSPSEKPWAHKAPGTEVCISPLLFDSLRIPGGNILI